MFDPVYVATLSPLVMGETEKSWIQQMSIENGFIDVEADVNLDGGYTTVGEKLAVLRPEENQLIRAWLGRWYELGPGIVAVHGGTEGKHYEKTQNIKQAELAIMRIVFKIPLPVTDGSIQWAGFS